MKAIRTFFGILMILIILGGLGYIGWSYFIQGNHGMLGMNPPSMTTPDQGQNMPGMDSPNTTVPGHNQTGQQDNNALNITAVQNKDSLNQIITIINDAFNQITIDPYSKIIVPGTVPNQTQGGGTINVYPNGPGSTSLNIAPGAVAPNNVPSTTTANQPAVVYDQTKLEQLHRGIFRLSQGQMQLNDLNDDLTLQATMTETNLSSSQVYSLRYNTALQNKMKFNNAINLISSAMDLVNVNPYSSPNGYLYNSDAMQRLNNGIYDLAKGMAMASKLNSQFSVQMAQASSAMNNLNSMSGMNMTMNNGLGSLISIDNIPFIFSIILVLMIIGLIAGILGSISQAFRGKSK